jgi:hypothetical protein
MWDRSIVVLFTSRGAPIAERLDASLMNDMAPDWTVPTGALIARWLSENRMSGPRFAYEAQIDLAWLMRFLDGRAPLTMSLALRIHARTTLNPERLMATDRQYWNDLAAGRTRRQ